MSLCVTGIVVPDVLKGYTAFIFRVKLCKEKCGFLCVCVELHTQIHLHGCIVLGLPDPEDEGTMTLQNILSYTPNVTE